MVRPVDPNEDVRYIAKEDRGRDEHQQTVWILRPLKAKALAKLEDNLAQSQPKKKGGGLKFQTGTHILDALDKGLNGVENFGDVEIELGGLTVKAERQARDEFYDRIPPEIRRELADVITGDAEIDEEATENLS